MSLLLDALSCKNSARPPIWLMRQAGRYMPTYQALRRQYPIEVLFRQSELIEQVTLLPLHDLHVDAAIIFSDILIALDGLGFGWKVQEGVGPVIEKSSLSLVSFKKSEPADTYTFLGKAIGSLKLQLKVPLIGFVGGPFTIASYLIEGQSTKDFKKTKALLYTDRDHFEEILNAITDELIGLARYQIQQGVDAIQIFDTHLSELNLSDLTDVALPHLARLTATIKPVPTLLFARHSAISIPHLATLKPTGLSLDGSVCLKAMRKLYPHLALQGNLDPAVLLGTHQLIAKKAQNILDQMEGDPGFIFNLGHGIWPQTPFDNVRFLTDYVRSHCHSFA